MLPYALCTHAREGLQPRAGQKSNASEQMVGGTPGDHEDGDLMRV